MSRILTVTIFALMLAGCVSEPSYDKSAMPKATVAMRQAMAMCGKEQTPSKFTAYKFMACRVAAERNFAMEIHLPNMNVFDIYAEKMMALAADYDAGHISPMRMDRRAASIRDDYRRDCDCLKDRSITYDWAPSPTPEHP